MTVQLTVASTVPEILAPTVTLPESLRRTEAGADLVGLPGTAGWTESVAEAIRGGARGVLVVEPVAADPADLQALADERSVPVVLDSLWAGNPAVEAAASSFGALAEEGALVEARVDLPLGSDLDQAALDLLALVGRAVGPVGSLRFVRRNGSGWDALARFANGASGALGAILTDSRPPAATVRLVRPRDAVELAIPGPQTAAPGHAIVTGPDGATLLETRYETAHRASWRRLHGLVVGGGTAEDLAAFASHVSVLRAAAR